ncbi:MAG: hypothetical protein AB7P17_07545 [Nitrospirales bacterium]
MGRYSLFGSLRDLLKADPHMFEVTFIGHSMGMIILNRVLQEFPDFPVRNIVYMAAACSIHDFETSVIPYLQRKDNQHTRFYNLMLHPDAEVREWQKNFLDLTPRGSLLVWIDNFLSNPQTTLDRTLGSWENIIQAAHIIPPDVQSRITLKAFCIGSKNCKAPITHGAFSDSQYRFWKPESGKFQQATESQKETVGSDPASHSRILIHLIHRTHILRSVRCLGFAGDRLSPRVKADFLGGVQPLTLIVF